MKIIKDYHGCYGICPSCGRRVYFGGSGCACLSGRAECDCGKWYNLFGQEILPPWMETPWEGTPWDDDEGDY